MERGAVGLALAVASATSFGTSGAFASSLITAGWTPGAAVLTRVGVAAVLLTLPAWWQLRSRWNQLRGSAALSLGYGLFGVAVPQLCYFEAVQRIPVGAALMLEYSGSALVVLWMWLRHGERPRRLTIVGAAVAVLGLALVLNLGGVHAVNLVGVLWGLGAAVGLAVYFLLSASTRQLVPPLAFAWSSLTVGALALAVFGMLGIVPLAAPHADVTLAGQRMSWVLPVLGLSLVAAVFAYLTGIAAARMLGARLASFVGLVEVLAAVGFAWALLGQAPTLLQALGGTLVIAGVVTLRLGEPGQRSQRPQSSPTVPVVVRRRPHDVHGYVPRPDARERAVLKSR
jgi:drug/metabolite transporter (DMT)-like permease